MRYRIGLRRGGDPPPSMTPHDAKTPFSETSLREPHIEKVRENTEMASCGVMPECEEAYANGSEGGEKPPASCVNCGSDRWRWEPVTAMRPEGAWVCRTCSHARATDGQGPRVHGWRRDDIHAPLLVRGVGAAKRRRMRYP